MRDDRVAELIEEATSARWNRRQILQRAGILGLSVPAISMVLAACGGDAGTADEGDSTSASGGGTQASPTTGSGGVASPAAGGGIPTVPTGASPTEGEGAATGSGGIINLNTTLGDSGIGNPIITSSIQYIQWYVFNRLVHYDDEGTLQPELAKSWEYSDDNLELTITLNEGVKWHDGEDFTADDVIFTFETIVNEDTDTPLRSNLQVAGEVVTWEKVDDYTIRITTPEPFAPFLFSLEDIEIIPEHILSGVADINTDAFNKNPVGTGSYTLDDWQPDQFYKLVPFDEHFRGRPKNDGLTVFFQADTDVGSAALDAGEIDMMFTPPELQERYEDSSDFTLHNYVYFTPITLSFNHKHPILQDLVVRQAIAMAIDKQTLNDTVTKGRGILANNQFAESGPLDRYNDYDNVQPLEFNLEEANAMLDEAGYTMGGDGIRVSPDGDRFAFNIITYSGFEEYQNGQVIIQEMLAELGIEVTPQVVDYSTLEGMWADENDDPANRALELEEWPHPFEFDPDLYNELHSDSLPPTGLNYMWFSDADVDRLIEDGRRETDPDARVEIYKQLDVRRNEVLPCIPLYNAVDGWVVSNAVQGVKDTPYYRRYVLIAAQDWWKES